MNVDFHFDVMCPWAYQTSLWMREVRQQRDVTIAWRFFSLEEVNHIDGTKHPWERPWSYGWSLLRIAARLRAIDMDLVDTFYLRAGRLLHQDGQKVHTREVATDVIRRMGLDAGMVDEALADPATSDEVMADHRRVLAAGGYGVPTMFLDGSTCLFGPVLAPAPPAPLAGRLWDLVTGWAEFPRLYELRRPKTQADWAHIENCFRPYLSARDWKTVQNPVA
jgi:2-hydroxychromene-2-carboxylate isomerase